MGKRQAHIAAQKKRIQGHALCFPALYESAAFSKTIQPLQFASKILYFEAVIDYDKPQSKNIFINCAHICWLITFDVEKYHFLDNFHKF